MAELGCEGGQRAGGGGDESGGDGRAAEVESERFSGHRGTVQVAVVMVVDVGEGVRDGLGDGGEGDAHGAGGG